MFFKDIPFYSPQITRRYLYCRNVSDPNNLPYNHCVDLMYFKGHYCALWNANAAPGEGLDGQYNYVAFSDDFASWTKPVRIFDNADYCDNPIHADHQWQPGLINVRDEYLLCAWCAVGGGHSRLFVSRSEDGLHWHNTEVRNAPDALFGRVQGFPTNHGCITSTGRLIFPCSLPDILDTPLGYGCEYTKYSGLLMSDDGGESWFWSEPIRCANFEDYGEVTSVPGEEWISTWEPMVYNQPDGRLGLLVRNSQAQGRPDLPETPCRMLFYSVSDDDGKTWPPALPVEVETICSRNFTLGCDEMNSGFMMLHNDQQVRVPKCISFDRYHMSAFVAPTEDPDTFLPGPMLFPQGRSYYPNGFVKDNTLYFGVSLPAGIGCGTLSPLPDFSHPFLMIREGRVAPEALGNGIFNMQTCETTIPLVLTRELTEADRLSLSFSLTVEAYDDAEYPLLTAGGVSRNGFVLKAVCRKDGECLCVYCADGREYDLGHLPRQTPLRFAVTFEKERTFVRVNDGAPADIPGAVIRKLAFGGLYQTQLWPDLMRNYARILLDTASITLEA